MATPDDLTLSHLVPTSHGLQPRPAPYVSASSLDGRLGIEIGFHRSTPTQGTRGLTSTDGLELIATVRLPEELESATGPLQPLAHITLSFCFDTGQQRVQVQAGDLSINIPQRTKQFCVIRKVTNDLQSFVAEETAFME